MELTLKELLESSDVLLRLLNKELPVKTAYWLSRLYKSVGSELKQYNLHRDNLVKKYGKGTEDGAFSIDQDDKPSMEKFIKDNEELLTVAIKLSYEPLPVEALGDIKISAVDMSNLTLFFTESK